MIALSLALCLWGLLAFAGWWMWLRARTPPPHPLGARFEVLEARVQANSEWSEGAIQNAEDRRRKLSKRVADLEFKQLGKRLASPEDET